MEEEYRFRIQKLHGMTTPRLVIKTQIQKLHGMVTPRLIIKSRTQILKGETIAEAGDDCRKWRRLQSKTVCPKLEETIAKRRLQPKSMYPKFEETIAKRRLRRLRVSWTCPRRLRKTIVDDCVCPLVGLSATPGVGGMPVR